MATGTGSYGRVPAERQTKRGSYQRRTKPKVKYPIDLTKEIPPQKLKRMARAVKLAEEQAKERLAANIGRAGDKDDVIVLPMLYSCLESGRVEEIDALMMEVVSFMIDIPALFKRAEKLHEQLYGER